MVRFKRLDNSITARLKSQALVEIPEIYKQVLSEGGSTVVQITRVIPETQEVRILTPHNQPYTIPCSLVTPSLQLTQAMRV